MVTKLFWFQLSGSNAHQVTLREIPKYLSGPFTCEVSADAPYFSTKTVTTNLTVIGMLQF